jgi:putative ABC transport system permease protein
MLKESFIITMTTADIIEETYTALKANKIRSGLTMLGIVIGISSVIALVSIGQGAQSTINASIQSIGSNLIIVIPGVVQPGRGVVSTGRGAAQSLTNADAEAITTQVQNIAGVAPEVQGRRQVTARGTNTNTTIIGSTPNYLTVRNFEIEEGTFISDANVRSNAKVAVLGPTTRDDLFGEGTEAVGQAVRIGGVEFKVIGVTVAKGGSGFQNPDDAIYIPYTTDELFLQGNQYLSDISVSAASAEVATQVQNDITALLLERHHINDPSQADFSTVNQADIIAAAGSVTQTFTLLLGAVAGISLLVGGIGIMNMMLTTVTERTKEIGLRKAIGATAGDINKQFLAEAVALTFMGGLIGVVLGWLAAFGVSSTGLIKTTVSLSSILLAFGVSALIGIVFGYYPARRASRLNPIDALRYE